MSKSIFLCLLIILLLAGIQLIGQTLAFPGAEGGGKYTTGGRGGKVLFVENLNDKGKGSLRKAVEAQGPRIVVFRVSGTIELEKTLSIKNDSITIAGQTAPGDGICLKNYGIQVEADNVIIRYIRIRTGNESKQEMDAISGINHKNIIIDHCSFSWSNDETASFYNNSNFTMQWCIISESLNISSHHKGEHGYGGIWGGNNATFHHNLLSDHNSRNPRFCGSRYTNKPEEEKADFRNNVIYNWGNNSAYGGEEGNYNMVNNYYKPGPATDKKCTKRILQLTQSFLDTRYNEDTLGAGKFYIKGNVMDGFPEVTKNNWKYGVQGEDVTEIIKAKSKLRRPVSHTKIKTQSASDAFKDVMSYAGAGLRRDAVDRRIVEETRTGIETYGETFHGGKKGIIDSPFEVGGWPVLKQETAPIDSDNDGMADEWEALNGLNPDNQSDGNSYTLVKKNTNLEVYLNFLVENAMVSIKTKK
jgi:pectate lyase